MQTKQQIQQLLASAGVWPNKRYGQNFLIDLNLIRLLLETAQICDKDVVLEVGCGTGSLTEELAAQAGKVISVEIDSVLAKVAAKRLSAQPNAEIAIGDILETKHTISQTVLEKIAAARKEHKGRFLLVANLPYSAASPTMMNLINGTVFVDAMYVTVQKEVAMRMIAEPGTEHYGSLSIMMNATGRLKLIRTLKPSVFWPQPQVDSAIISFERDPEKAARIADVDLFNQCINLFIGHRRKMLKACTKLATGKLEQIQDWQSIFEKAGIDGELRAEEISPEQYVTLSNLCRAQVK